MIILDFSQIKPVSRSVNINTPNLIAPHNPNLASEFYERLVEMINNFDDELDENHEVGMRLVSFGQTVQFHVEDLGYNNPSLIRFYGRNETGNKIELIQHVSQISFLLMAVERLDPEVPKKRIGFSREEEEE